MADGYPHAQAVLDLLNATELTAALGEGGPGVDVVLYPDPGTDESSSLVCWQDVVVYIPLHALGNGPERALWVMDKVRSTLTGAKPAVAGRSVQPMWQEQSPSPLQRDDDVSPPVFYSFAEYGIRSSPA